MPDRPARRVCCPPPFISFAHAPRAGTKTGRERACLVGEEYAMLLIGPAALDGGER